MTTPITKIIPALGDFSSDAIVHKVHTRFESNDCDVIKISVPIRTHVFCLRNPEHIKYITTCKQADTRKPRDVVPKADWMMGNGVFNDLGGESWRAKRVPLNPAFLPRHSAYFCEALPEALEEMKARWDKFGPAVSIDIHGEILQMVLDFAVYAMFSKRLDRDELHWLVEAVEFSEEMFATISPLWFPTSSNLKFRKVGRRFHALMQNMLDERRAAHSDRADVLHFLMRSGDRSGVQLGDEEVCAEMFSALLGTPAAALPILWALYFFTVRPDILQKVRSELCSVVGTRTPRPEDLPRLRYLDMFVKEIIRFYPPFWGSLRYAEEAVAFDGYSFPPRSIFAMMRAAAHRHPRFWRDPGKFLPERWSAEDPDPGIRNAYLPFGWGPRLCLGRHLATLLCPIAISFIAQNFDCQINAEEPVHLKYLFATYPARKLMATVGPVHSM